MWVVKEGKVFLVTSRIPGQMMVSVAITEMGTLGMGICGWGSVEKQEFSYPKESLDRELQVESPQNIDDIIV